MTSGCHRQWILMRHTGACTGSRIAAGVVQASCQSCCRTCDRGRSLLLSLHWHRFVAHGQRACVVVEHAGRCPPPTLQRGTGLHADLIATDCSSVHFGWGSCRLYALTFQVKVIGCSSRALYVLTFQVNVIGRWTSCRLYLLTFQVKSFRWQFMSLLLCPLLCV